MFHQQSVVAGDAHQHNAPAQPHHLGGLRDGVAGPRSLDGHVHAAAMRFLRDAAALAPPMPEAVSVFDPAPMTMERIAGKSRAQLLVQSTSRARLQPFLAAWSASLYAGRFPGVRWHIDVDPTEF